MKRAGFFLRSVCHFTSGATALALLLAVGCGREPSPVKPRLVGQGVVDSRGAALTVSSTDTQPPAGTTDTATGSSEAAPSAPASGPATVASATADIPAGAIADATPMALTETAALTDPELLNAPEILGPAYRLTPAGVQFQQKAKLTVSCVQNTRPLIASTNLRLSRFKDGAWEPLEGATWKPTTCVAEGLTGESGTFGLVPEHPVDSIDEVEDTHFTVGAVTVTSSEKIVASIAVSADALRMEFKSTNKKTSTSITIDGLRPNGDILVFDGSYDKKTQGVSDANGRFTYTQAISTRWRTVWAQPVPATIYLTATGGGCGSLGTWNNTTKTCTMTHGVITAVQITGASTKLNCDWYSIVGNRSGAGVVLSANGSQVYNCIIANWDIGVAVNSGMTSTVVRSNVISAVTDAVNTQGATSIWSNYMAGGTILGYSLLTPSVGIRTSGPQEMYYNDIKASYRGIYSTSLQIPQYADNQLASPNTRGNYWGRDCSTTLTGPWFVPGTDGRPTVMTDRAPYGYPLHYFTNYPRSGYMMNAYTPWPAPGCDADKDGDGKARSSLTGGTDNCDTDDVPLHLNKNNWTSAACAYGNTGCRDLDHDNWYIACDRYFTISGPDCNDANAAINPATIWYKDNDGDFYSDGTTLVQCAQPTGYKLVSQLIATSGDCDDNDPYKTPATIWYRDMDNDRYSNGSTLTQCAQPTGYALSKDVLSGTDCNDGNAAINPGATELPGTGVSENCDTWELCYADADLDGYRSGSNTVVTHDIPCLEAGHARVDVEVDCNDGDAAVNPSATEVAGVGGDQDCDGAETCYLDGDQDNYRSTDTVETEDLMCLIGLYHAPASKAVDCDDGDAQVFQLLPGYTDSDHDGYGTGTSSPVCSGTVLPLGYSSNNTDCNDLDAAVNPDPDTNERCGAPLDPNYPGAGIDDDCDGLVDEGCPCTFTGPEICGDGIDNDCDWHVDEGWGEECGFVEPTPWAPGRIEGNYGVTNDGAATYTMPIVVPPGRNGIQPSLALTYNSRQPNGWLGMGWTLSGLSEIRRCRQNFAQDGNVRGIGFDADDSYCLDGNRLVQLEASSCGASTVEYRTERETFSRICGHWMSPSGPGYFRVWTKSGQIMDYGDSGADGNLSGAELSGPSGTLAWALSRVEDRSHNYMVVGYGSRLVPDVSNDDTGDVPWTDSLGPQFFVRTIRYTGNTWEDAPTKRRVDFEYSQRPDEFVGYTAGVRVDRASALTSIRTYGPSDELVRDYRLFYETSAATGRSLLSKVYECDGTGECERPTELQWSPGPNAFEHVATSQLGYPGEPAQGVQADLDGDGKDEVAYSSEGSNFETWTILHFDTQGNVSSSTVAGPFRNDSYVYVYAFASPPIAMDWDHDGAAEILLPRTCSAPTGASLARPEGWNCVDVNYAIGTMQVLKLVDGDFQAIDTMIPTDYLMNVDKLVPIKVAVADVDGNGLPEVGYCDPGSASINFYRSADGGPMYWSQVPGTFNCDHLRMLSLDANGDGKEELVLEDALNANIKLLEYLDPQDPPSPWHLTSVNLRSHFMSAHSPFWDPKDVRLVADINGDGLKDIVMPDEDFNSFEAWLSTGSSEANAQFKKRQTVVPAPYSSFENMAQARVVDFDGDGRDDLLVPSVDPSQYTIPGRGYLLCPLDGVGGYCVWSVLRTTAAGWEKTPTTMKYYKPWVGSSYEQPVFVLDANGDALADLITIQKQASTEGGEWTTWKHAGTTPDLLTAVRDGFNPTPDTPYGLQLYQPSVQFTYAPTTQGVVYTPHVGPLGIWDVRALVSPMLVVSHVKAYVGFLDLREWSHSYKDGRTQINGLGWLGFAEHTIEDSQRGQTTILTLDNETRISAPSAFPRVGLVTQAQTDSWVTDPNNSPLLRRTTTTSTYTVATRNGDETYFPYESYRQQVVSEGPSSSGLVLLADAIQNVSQIDTLGNVEMGGSSSHTLLAASGGSIPSWATEMLGIETAGAASQFHVDYLNDATNWLIGLPTYQQVQSTSPFCVNAGIPNCPAGGNAYRTTEFGYYPSGLLSYQTTEPNDFPRRVRTEFTYDGYGNVTQVAAAGLHRPDQQAVTRTTITSYDSSEHIFPASVTNPELHVEYFTYHAAHGVLHTRTDANSLTTTWDIDGFGRVRTEARPNGAEDWVEILDGFSEEGLSEGVSLVVYTYRADGSWVEVWYDRLGREIGKSWPSFGSAYDVEQDTTYDGLGRKSGVSIPHLVNETATWVEYSYDALDRPTQVIDRDGTTTLAYNGFLATTTNARAYPTTGLRSLRGETLAISDANGGLTKYRYGAFGYPWHVTDPAGNDMVMVPDQYGRRQSLADPDLGSHTYEYNAFGDVIWQDHGSGRQVSYTYDRLGRLVQRSDGDGGNYFTWDQGGGKGVGSLAGNLSMDGTSQSYQYDANYGYLTQVHAHVYYDAQVPVAEFTMDLGYDTIGRLSTIDYPESVAAYQRFGVRYAYTNRGYLSGITNDKTAELLWRPDAINAEGKLTQATFGNGDVTSRSYFASSGRLETLSTLNGSGCALQDFSFSYDDNGNLDYRSQRTASQWLGGACSSTTQTERNFIYDGLDRLTTEERRIGGSGSFATHLSVGYNNIGNILTKSEPGVYSWAYSYTSTQPHAATAVGTQVFAYDPATGNQTTRPTHTATWTTFNKPRVLSPTGGSSTYTYWYDAFGQRVVQKATQQGQEDITLYAGSDFERFMPDFSYGDLVEDRYYVRAGGEVVAEVLRVSSSGGESEDAYFIHTDNLGSPNVIAGDSGGLVGERIYDAFGKLESSWNNYFEGLTVGFTGHEDENGAGLVNMRGRVYDPTVGRFTSPDPTVPDPLNSQSLNRYSYVHNNPMSWTDPSGFAEVDEDGEPGGEQPSGPEDPGGPIHKTEGAGPEKLVEPVSAPPKEATGQTVGCHDSSCERSTANDKAVMNTIGVATAVSDYMLNPAAVYGQLAGEALGIANEELTEQVGEENMRAFDFVTAMSIVEPHAFVLLGTAWMYARFPTWASRVPGLSRIPRFSCFAPGTLVVTESGYVPIEELRPGERVWAADPDTGRLELMPVRAVTQRESEWLVKLTVAGTEITTTGEHPFWVDGRGWETAIALAPGDLLRELDGDSLVVEWAEVEHGPATVYNLEVEGLHTYFVSDAEILVHNKGWIGRILAARGNPALARKLGAAGEAAAGIAKNTTRIPSLTGTANYRIPDVLSREARLIGEVKNVGSLSYTNQLRDFAAYAQKEGFRFELTVRQGTQLSGPLQQAINAGDIILLRALP